MPMSDDEFRSNVMQAEVDADNNSEDYMIDNRTYMEYYLGCPNGLEVEEQSQVTSMDVQDVVESDMPSLVRLFLGAQEILEFVPATSDPRDVLEAAEKTKYVHWIIKNQRDSFTMQHGWLKASEIQTIGTIHYSWDERKEPMIKHYKGLSDEEMLMIIDDIQIEASRNDLEFKIETQTETSKGWELKIKLTRTIEEVKLELIPIEEMLISRNPRNKDDTTLIGHERLVRRGDLIAQGFDKEKLKKVSAQTSLNDDRMKNIRFKRSGGFTNVPNLADPANDLLRVRNLYIKIDFDQDGIAERRHVIKIGQEIFTNEQFDHVPYAINSAILMPNTLLGRSRAEITVETPFIGDKSLLVIQYLDSARAQTTGSLMANQSLDSDALYKESATRFQGVEAAGAAKTELVARVLAETGYRDLFEGVAWLVSHFQSDQKEIMVLGEPLTINPAMWWHDHRLESRVGIAAGDDEEILSNMTGILTIQNQAKEQGMSIVDEKKIYNTNVRILRAMGIERVSDFFNDPEKEEEVLLAENEKLTQMVQELEQAVQDNPLAEAEEVKAEAELIKAQGKAQLEIAQLQENQRQFNEKQSADMQQFMLGLEEKYAELEAKFAIDIVGKGPNDQAA